MTKRDEKPKPKRKPVSIDDETVRDLLRIMRNSTQEECPERDRIAPDGVCEMYVRFGFDEADLRDLKDHARRLGVSSDTMLKAAWVLVAREFSNEPLPARTVEDLARRGISILRNRDLS